MLPYSKKNAVSLLIFTLFFTLLTVNPFSAKAQKEEKVLDIFHWCLPDCPDDKWQPTTTDLQYTFTIGTCTFRVNYRYRKACNQYCDLHIRTIDNLSGSDPLCAAYNLQTLLQIASVKLIQNAIATGLHDNLCTPAFPGDCKTSWRVSNASCWRYWNQWVVGNWSGSWGGCDQEICCLNQYTVCMDQYGQIIVTKVSSFSTGQCPLENPGYPCTNVCE